MSLQAVSTSQVSRFAHAATWPSAVPASRKRPISTPHVEELFPASNVVLFHRPLPIDTLRAPHHQDEDNTVEKSHPNEAGNFGQENTPKISGYDTTDTLVDFVRTRAIHYQQKELARITGLSVKQVQNLRLGISGVSGKTLTNWCRNDARFAAEYAAYVGIIRPGEAEMSAALTQLFNAKARAPHA